MDELTLEAMFDDLVIPAEPGSEDRVKRSVATAMAKRRRRPPRVALAAAVALAIGVSPVGAEIASTVRGIFHGDPPPVPATQQQIEKATHGGSGGAASSVSADPDPASLVRHCQTVLDEAGGYQADASGEELRCEIVVAKASGRLAPGEYEPGELEEALRKALGPAGG
jgi:hypothetical protein